MQNNPNAEIFNYSNTPIQANPPQHLYYNQQNIHPPHQFNSNFHQHPNMFSTNHYPHYPQYPPNFGGHYNNQQFFPNYPNNMINFGDSSHSGTMLNFQQNLPANEGFQHLYHPNLPTTQQATPSSFNIEENRSFKASKNTIAPASSNLAQSHNYLHQGESSNPSFNHSNKKGFQPWKQPNLAHAQPSNPNIQHPNMEIDLNVEPLSSPYEELNDPQLQHSPDSTHSAGFDSQNFTYVQPSRPNVQHANSEGYQPWTQTDSIQGQSSNTHINHSNFGAFQNWKQPNLPHEGSSNPPNIEEFQPLTRPKKPQGFRPYKKRG